MSRENSIPSRNKPPASSSTTTTAKNVYYAEGPGPQISGQIAYARRGAAKQNHFAPNGGDLVEARRTRAANRNRQAGPTNSGSLAIISATRRASFLVSNFTAERRPGSSPKEACAIQFVTGSTWHDSHACGTALLSAGLIPHDIIKPISRVCRGMPSLGETSA